jgi:hypothetical protein
MNKAQHFIAAIGVLVGMGLFSFVYMMAGRAKAEEEAKVIGDPAPGIRIDKEKFFPGLGTVRVINIDGQRYVVIKGVHSIAIEKMTEPWDVRP